MPEGREVREGKRRPEGGDELDRFMDGVRAKYPESAEGTGRVKGLGTRSEVPVASEGEADELDRFMDEVRAKYPEAMARPPQRRGENSEAQVSRQENDLAREPLEEDDGPKAADSRGQGPRGSGGDKLGETVEEMRRPEREYIAEFEAVAREVPRKDGSNIRFDIEKKAFVRETGIALDGGTKEITGTVGDDTEFRVVHARSEGRRLYITVPPEEKEKFKVGEKYPLKFRSVEDKHTFTSFEGKEGQVWLQLQKAALESVGIDQRSLEGKEPQERVAEIMLRNLSHQGEGPKRFFSQVSPEDGVSLKLARAGVSKDDELQLEAGRMYGKNDFVKDFEANKGKNLENVKLRTEGKRMLMEVDGREFELKEGKLDVHGLRVFLKGKIDQYRGDVRFIFDANEDTIATKTGGGRGIDGFVSSERDGIAIRYSEGGREVFIPFREQLEKERWPMQKFREGILSVEGQNLESIHKFRLSDELAEYINRRLEKLRPYGKFRNPEIGRIGEDIGSAVLEKMGVIEIERHPFDKRGPGPEYWKHGTDSLHRDARDNCFRLFEFRHWKNSKEGEQKAVDDVLHRKDDERKHERYGRMDGGAFIAGVVIDIGKRSGELSIRRVW